MKLVIKGLSVYVIILFSYSCSCIKHNPTAPPLISIPQTNIPNNTYNIISSLPNNATIDEINSKITSIINEIESSRIEDMDSVVIAIHLLRNQENIVKALSNFYHNTNKTNYSTRKLVVQIMGEVQRSDAQQFFEEVIWHSLPSENSGSARLERMNEEIIMMKAVCGVAYLRSRRGFELTKKVIIDHPSKSVRLMAIDAYIWNKDDKNEAQKQLYSFLPEDLWKYVSRTRFKKRVNINEFNTEVEKWNSRFGNNFE